MAQVEGQVTFITGAASGMGLGMAHAFSRAGRRVGIAGLRRDAIDRARAGDRDHGAAVLVGAVGVRHQTLRPAGRQPAPLSGRDAVRCRS
jgi:NAD(P)-dependent dehydrogenase (short-subunit alcohol dehydrogenase family)